MTRPATPVPGWFAQRRTNDAPKTNNTMQLAPMLALALLPACGSYDYRFDSVADALRFVDEAVSENQIQALKEALHDRDHDEPYELAEDSRDTAFQMLRDASVRNVRLEAVIADDNHARERVRKTLEVRTGDKCYRFRLRLGGEVNGGSILMYAGAGDSIGVIWDRLDGKVLLMDLRTFSVGF